MRNTHLLFDNFNIMNSVRPDEDRRELTLEQMRLEEYISECGFGTTSPPADKLKTTYCMADDPHSTTILPNGNLGKCEHYSDDGFWGSIYSDEKNEEVLREWKTRRAPIELCAACPILPQCNKLKNCPDDIECDKYMQAHALSKVYRQMQNAYDKFLKQDKE